MKNFLQSPSKIILIFSIAFILTGCATFKNSSNVPVLDNVPPTKYVLDPPLLTNMPTPKEEDPVSPVEPLLIPCRNPQMNYIPTETDSDYVLVEPEQTVDGRRFYNLSKFKISFSLTSENYNVFKDRDSTSEFDNGFIVESEEDPNCLPMGDAWPIGLQIEKDTDIATELKDAKAYELNFPVEEVKINDLNFTKMTETYLGGTLADVYFYQVGDSIYKFSSFQKEQVILLEILNSLKIEE